MTRDEIRKFLDAIKDLYPNFHSDGISSFAVESWRRALAEYRLIESEEALKRYHADDVKGFPPQPGQIAALITAQKKAVAPEAREYGCGYCRENGHGDGYIKVIVPAGAKDKDGQVYPYGMEVYIDCPCQREARSVSTENIARLKRNIERLASRGWLPYAYTNQDLPF